MHQFLFCLAAIAALRKFTPGIGFSRRAIGLQRQRQLPDSISVALAHLKGRLNFRERTLVGEDRREAEGLFSQ